MRQTSPTGRHRITALTVAGLAVIALAACKSTTTASPAGSTLPSGQAPSDAVDPSDEPSAPVTEPSVDASQAAAGAVRCTDAIKSAVASLVTVPVGAAFNPLADSGQASSSAYACMYGIGKNAVLTGSAVVNADDDTVLVTFLGVGGPNNYANSVGFKMTPVSGVGDKAEYSFDPTSNQAPDFFALKGDTYCEVQINNGDDAATELGVKAQGDGIDASGAPTVAQKEGAICNAVFSG